APPRAIHTPNSGRPPMRDVWASTAGFFFSKQKTAYEFSARLEFSRVLSRSLRAREARPAAAAQAGLRHFLDHGLAPQLQRPRQRSEERRVGKEWRGRGDADAQKQHFEP